MSNGLVNRQYVGARYVPKIMGEWNKTLQYEALSVVTYMGNSFTSKVPVPANVDITNEDYWVNTGNYNAQVEEYRKETANVKEEVKQRITYFNTVNDMINNATIDNIIVKTLGYYSVDDNGGALYKIVSNKPASYHVKINDTLYAILITDGWGNPRQYGARGDGINDDTNAFIECFKNNKVYIPNGKYLLKTEINIDSTRYITGESNDTILMGKLVSTVAKTGRVISNLSFISNAKYADYGIKGIFAFETLRNIRCDNCNIGFEFEYGTWLINIENIWISYCNTGIKAPNQFNAINCNGTFQHCNNAIILTGDSRQFNIHNSDFEINTCCIQNNASAYNLNIDNSYIEYCNTFLSMSNTVESSYITIDNNYFISNGKDIGWVIKLEKSSTSDVKNTCVFLTNNCLYNSNNNAPISFTNDKTECYVAINVENNRYAYSTPPTNYFDLFDSNTIPTAYGEYLAIKSDLPYIIYDKCYIYANYRGALSKTRGNKSYSINGYINMTSSGAGRIQIPLKKNIFTSTSTIYGMATVYYSDNTYSSTSLVGSVDTMYFYADSSKTVSKIYINTTADVR